MELFEEILKDDILELGGKKFRSRLIVGTGKYENMEIMQEALELSGTEMVTVALRRMNLDEKGEKTLLDYIDPKKYTIIPNTAGCYTVDEALRVADLAEELGLEFIKLEIIGDDLTLMPDTCATIEAAKILVKRGFKVLAYTNDDPVVALKLQDIGCTSVMPAGAPIGSGQGILNPNNIRIILERLEVPVIVDAGVGTGSDVVKAMELGCDGVLLNTSIAQAKDPKKMALSMRFAWMCGRLSYLAGRIPKKLYAKASSPEFDFR